MENALISQFGLDWKLFLSQLFNFALILIILRAFVYKPLIKLLNKRRDKIEQGLVKAQEAEKRLFEVDEIAKGKIKQAEQESVAIISRADVKKKHLETEIMAKAKKREEELLKKAEDMAEGRKQEIYSEIQKNAKDLIKSAMAKAIDENPEKVDQKLIEKAVIALKNEL
jgi:F-type H+-transporting ATPase subunit b